MQNALSVFLSVMEEFTVFLPSNSCPERFPDNSPSDFRIEIAHPIRLEGEWEVGLQNINYAAFIDEKLQKATFDVKYEYQKTVNNDKVHRYRLTDDNKWKGYSGVLPQKFEPDPKNLDGILEALNSLNDSILQSGEVERVGKLFKFGKTQKGKPYYRGYNEFFTMKLPAIIAERLGFNWENRFSGMGYWEGYSSSKQVMPKRLLTIEDYRAVYHTHSHVQRKMRIVLKGFKEDVGKLNPATVAKLWSERIEKQTQIKMYFNEGSKMIVQVPAKIAVYFSYSLGEYFFHNRPIIGATKRWATYATNFDKDYQNETWYIDVYEDNVEDFKSFVKEKDRFDIDFFPWQFPSNETLMSYIRKTVKDTLMQRLGDKYDKVNHMFSIERTNNNHSKLQVGASVSIRFSKNLAHLFGLSDERLPSSEVKESTTTIWGARELKELHEQQKHLFVLCDIIKPTAYGVNRFPIIGDFIHNNTNSVTINEVRFEPIMFLPVKQTVIDFVHIQLTDIEYKPIIIKDSKTVVTLSFRKVEEKAMT